jgi:hypothetical protein
MIPAMTFVPIDRLEDALEILRDTLDDELTPLLDYFEETYIGRLQLNRRRRGVPQRRPPLFSPEIWSCYERTINSEARTNNFAEAAHRRLQAEFGVDHPSLWKFIDGLRIVQKSTDQLYENFVRGDTATKKRAKYQQNDNRILNIVEEFEIRQIGEYLQGLAHNVVMD